MSMFGEVHGWKGGGTAGEGGIPHYSLPALATSLLSLSARELPGAALLCAFGPGPRILLAPTLAEELAGAGRQ